ncbi:MAG TPA: 4'-phosphopantetheinyl transferase superfamily protein [Pseudomonadales bacterium]|nr:4'-phosphopantetheinyl transferase superfamily protein [Pseudomonadales bacterium]
MAIPAAPARLPANSIHLWLAPFPENISTALLACVTPEEHRRAATFASKRRQTEWLTGRALLRQCLAFYTGQDALSLVFGKTGAGKPTLDLDDAPAFNLSHGPRWIACAVSHAANIGIDVDCTARRNRLHDITARYFHPLEQAVLQQSADENAFRNGFFARWCLKEAYIKARGEMINSVRLHDIAFGVGDGTCSALFALPAGESWQFRHWQFGGDHHLALACELHTPDTPMRVDAVLWDPASCERQDVSHWFG